MTSTSDGTTADPFSYEEFSAWFDKHAARHLQPAYESAVTAVEQTLDERLDEPVRARVRVFGRVKSKGRTWKKLNGKYQGRVANLEDIPGVVDDLVGLRAVCTNLSDVNRVIEVFEAIEPYRDGNTPVLATVDETFKDYISRPKDSGYRAHHVNLCTSISVATTRHPVVCELQIRTLLQDGWGELTHEDTYKPGGYVPPLVDTLSRRMADLMATLDDLAEDLRGELDRLEAEALESRPVPDTRSSTSGEGGPADEGISSPVGDPVDQEIAGRELAEAYLRDRIGDLQGPISLAALAWELQREFGQDITNDWFGRGSFKDLLSHAAPDARISTEGPAYVLPSGFSDRKYARKLTRTDVPTAVALMHASDKGFPLVRGREWQRIYYALASATHQIPWEGEPDLRTVNSLTKTARDQSASREFGQVARRDINYVARALLDSNKLRPRMDNEEVEGEFVRTILRRADAMKLSRSSIRALEAWLKSEADDATRVRRPLRRVKLSDV